MDRNISFEAVYMTNSVHIYMLVHSIKQDGIKIFDRDGRFHVGW